MLIFSAQVWTDHLNMLAKEQTSERSMNTQGRAWERGEGAGRESSLGYPLHLRQTPARDSSVFGKHNICQRNTETAGPQVIKPHQKTATTWVLRREA